MNAVRPFSVGYSTAMGADRKPSSICKGAMQCPQELKSSGRAVGACASVSWHSCELLMESAITPAHTTYKDATNLIMVPRFSCTGCTSTPLDLRRVRQCEGCEDSSSLVSSTASSATSLALVGDPPTVASTSPLPAATRGCLESDYGLT